ncbi:MAG: zinc-binding dehydrogenase [Planctomycetes bacterium]|nr:zinc-binding dehydrogenase [Planctomycetota bacterium]
MKAIVNTAPNQIQWQDLPTPAPSPGQVRIRTAVCGICATDLEMIRGWTRTGFPAIPGHEWSGRVDAAGPGVDTALLGRSCVAENVLADGGEVGFEHPGGYGQFLLTEARNVRLLPAGFPMHTAALIEPLAVCARAMDRLKMVRTESALIFGDGVIGLLMLVLLKRAGVSSVTQVGGRPVRLELARQFGADAVINYHEAGLAGVVAVAAGSAFPNVIEASGSPQAMATAIKVATTGGKVLIVGDYGTARADFPWNRLLLRELELIGSNASAGAWDRAVGLATDGTIPLEKLISLRVPAAQFAVAFDRARNARDTVKIVLDWQEESS